MNDIHHHRHAASIARIGSYRESSWPAWWWLAAAIVTFHLTGFHPSKG